MMLFAAAVCLFVCYCAIVLMRLLPLLILKEDKNYGIIIYCTTRPLFIQNIGQLEAKEDSSSGVGHE